MKDNKSIKKIIKWSVSLFILILILSIYFYFSYKNNNSFDIYFLNLNKGRSVFIHTPNNKYILIDSGQNSEVIKSITSIMPFYNRDIDTIFLTNENAKNIGGFIDIISRYKVREIIKPEIMGTSTALSVLMKMIEENGIVVRGVKKGDSFDIDNISFSIFFPDTDFKFNKTSKSELAIDISYASSSILLLGDISKTIQKTFIDEIEKVDIVEYANSASDSLVSIELLNKIKPKYIVISKQIKANSNSSAKIFNNNSYSIINIKEKGDTHFRIGLNSVLELK